MKRNSLLGQSLVYGLPAGPLAMLGIPLYIYLPTYYYQLGLELSVVGGMLLLARVSDVVSDPLIGWLRDYWGPKGRYGLMAVGWLALLIGLWQLLLPNGNEAVGAFHLLFWAMWVYLAWTLIMIPYQALSAEVSQQHHIKTYYTAAREAFSMLGVVMVLVLPFLLPDPQDYRAVFALLYPLLAISLTFSLLLLGWRLRLMTPNKAPTPTPNPKLNIKILRRVWRDSASRTLLPAYFLNSLANGFSATLFLLFVENYLALNDYVGVLLLVFFLSGVVALPFWVLLSRKIGKYPAWRLSMAVACVSFIWVFFLEAGDLWAFAIISACAGLSVGADVALPSSIQADIAQKLSAKNGALSGLMFGIWGMLTKLALAFAVGLSFPILDIFGLEQSTTQSQYALVWLYAGVPIGIKLCVIYSLSSKET